MKPLVKWIGGKQKLAPEILEHFPEEFYGYHEPFAGAAAVFCELWNTYDLAGYRLTLGDANPYLMALYEMIQNKRGCERFQAAMWVYRTQYEKSSVEEREAMDYKARDQWNGSEKGRDPARFVFLKQTAFNGLWRVNKKGELNASWGKYETATLPDEDNVLEWHQALQHVELRPETYESLEPGEGEIVYVDPPYVGTFDGYTSKGFDHPAQTRLLARMHAWREAGATTVYSNTLDVQPLLELTWPDATIHELETFYAVNTDGSGRKKVPELLAL